MTNCRDPVSKKHYSSMACMMCGRTRSWLAKIDATRRSRLQARTKSSCVLRDEHQSKGSRYVLCESCHQQTTATDDIDDALRPCIDSCAFLAYILFYMLHPMPFPCPMQSFYASLVYTPPTILGIFSSFVSRSLLLLQPVLIVESQLFNHSQHADAEAQQPCHQCHK